MSEIVVFDPQRAVQMARDIKAVVTTLRQQVLVADVDYGIIPGTAKPTLMKPGAERLCAAFALSPVFTETGRTVVDFDKPLFHYEYECRLVHRETGQVWGSAIGSCNSMETKYGWRWVDESAVPPHLDPTRLVSKRDSITEFEFAIERAETSGQYGKPAAYWAMFRQAIEDGVAMRVMKPTKRGEAVAWVIQTVRYRVPNPDIYDQVNTISKMAQKRALIAAVLVATNASEFFTQDMEDMPADTSVVARLEHSVPTSEPVTDWYDDPSKVAHLVTRAVAAGFADSEGELLALIGETTWDVFKTGRGAWEALERAHADKTAQHENDQVF